MGIEQGIEQGEDRATQKIALNLLRKNISLETISEVTGLTTEQLQQLQASQVDG
jgi:predicted transposase/invertase (TIGR01784 family)